MKRLIHSLRRPAVRASAETGLTASAALPNSGFTFVDNSQGASAAVAELSKSLDTALEQIELNGNISEQLRLQLERLDTEAARYENSQMHSSTYSLWSCSYHDAQFLDVACKCAVGAYNADTAIEHDQFTFTRVHTIEPSLGGSTKAVTFTTVADPSCRSPHLPVLVVAIRGSASKVDHMVNANGAPKDMSSFIDIHALNMESNDHATSFEAHSGFLSSAQVAYPLTLGHVADAAMKGIKHILFTGHSAGGAVASLLYLKFLSEKADKYPSIRFSCITFGSPPTLQTRISSIPKTLSGNGFMLNIINEFDLVTRADTPYILSLVNLYRSTYQLKPLQETDSEMSITSTTLSEISAQRNAFSEYSRSNTWPILRPGFHHIGERVVLRTAGDFDLKAVKVSDEQFEQMLFCRISIHRRHHYAERIKAIEKGAFNGNHGW